MAEFMLYLGYLISGIKLVAIVVLIYFVPKIYKLMLDVRKELDEKNK